MPLSKERKLLNEEAKQNQYYTKSCYNGDIYEIQIKILAETVGAVEYSDCISAEG